MADFDPDTLARLTSYCGDPRTPHNVVVEPLEEYSDLTWSLDEFIAQLVAVRDAIPEENRKDARVNLKGYDSGKLVVSYQRLETPEELESRVARGLRYLQERDASDRAMYAVLKRKFAE